MKKRITRIEIKYLENGVGGVSNCNLLELCISIQTYINININININIIIVYVYMYINTFLLMVLIWSLFVVILFITGHRRF